MRLSPPIAVLAIAAAGLVASTLHQRQSLRLASQISAIELEGNRHLLRLIQRNGKRYIRHSRFIASKDGKVRYEVYDREIFTEPELVVHSLVAHEPKLAAEIIGTHAPMITDSLSTSEIESRYAKLGEQRTESQQWASNHRCTKLDTHVLPETVRFHFGGGSEEQLAVLEAGCVDSYSTLRRSKIDGARAALASALNVDLRQPLPN